MFQKSPDMLTVEIERIIAHMSKLSPDSDEYTAIAKSLELLYKARANKAAPKINPEYLAAAVQIVSLLVVLNHEKLSIITGRAFDMLRNKWRP